MYTSFNFLLCKAAVPDSADSSFGMGPGAQGNINLQGFPYFAFTCLKLFQNLATEIQVIKYTLLECKECFWFPHPHLLEKRWLGIY